MIKNKNHDEEEIKGKVRAVTSNFLKQKFFFPHELWSSCTILFSCAMLK